jgi:ParB/RepB/Spo0J family partition protein
MLVSTAKLRIAVENPRKTKADQAADNALAASLQEHGQLLPLLVLPDEKKGHFDVFDGGRRLKAANKIGLAQLEVRLYDGKFDADEIGTISNMARAAMHPLDEARVIARLAAEAETFESIAQRFGRTVQWVEQRMKLEALSPKIKARVRDGSMSLGTAAAFTLGTRKEQEAYLAQVKDEDDWRLREDHVRRHFTNQRIDAKYALFSLADYPAEFVSRDLFSESVTLTNVDLFHQMQRAAAAKIAEKLRAKGWGEVLERFSDVEDNFHNTYVRSYEKIPAAVRSKYVAVVHYSVGSGEVEVSDGYSLRKDAKKIRRGDSPSLDSVNPDDVAATTCFEMSQSQQHMVGALQTRGIATAIEKGDTWLALYTILAPLIATPDNPAPPWAGLSKKHVAWVGANVTFDEKIEPPAPPKVAFPDRDAFSKMSWEDVMELVRVAALAAMELIYRPSAEAAAHLETAGVEWFRWDPAYLRRFRMDALQDLATHAAIEPSGPKKSDLVTSMACHSGKHFLPIDWDAVRAKEETDRAARAQFTADDSLHEIDGDKGDDE